MQVIQPQHYTVRITKKQQLTEKTYQFECTLLTPKELHFTSGQYATFLIDAKTRRQYSFCSDPHQSSLFEIIVDTTPMGPGSRFFLEKQVGDEAMCLAPLGTFGLTDLPSKKVCIATGTGIAPFRSMLLNEISNANTNNSLSVISNSPISLYWGLRHEDDIYWDTEFRTIVGQLAGFQYFMCLSKPSAQWQGLRGHVTEHVLNQEKNLEHTEFYLCGNRAMIEEMSEKLSALNVKKEQIKTDMFY